MAVGGPGGDGKGAKRAFEYALGSLGSAVALPWMVT